MQDEKKEVKVSDEQLKKAFEENTKKIDVGNIDTTEKANITVLISSIQGVIDEIENKKSDFLKKKQLNAEKLDALRRTGKVKVDEEKTKRTEKASELYVSFIENVLKELRGDLTFFSDLISDNPPKQVRVLKDAPDHFLLHLKAKMSNTKRILKKTRKDFRVHFSRYTHDFNMQEKYLDYLAHYINMIELQQAKAGKK
jgi:hypothetical protein